MRTSDEHAKGSPTLDKRQVKDNLNRKFNATSKQAHVIFLENVPTKI